MQVLVFVIVPLRTFRTDPPLTLGRRASRVLVLPPIGRRAALPWMGSRSVRWSAGLAGTALLPGVGGLAGAPPAVLHLGAGVAAAGLGQARLPDRAVGGVHGGQRPVVARLRPLAVVEAAEGGAELLGHGVVYDGVDGAVGVDAGAAEEDEPVVQVGRGHEGVEEDQRAVGHPQQGEQDHHHRQHLGHL